jgi:hypothetical protein
MCILTGLTSVGLLNEICGQQDSMSGAQPTYSAFTFRVGILGLNTTLGLAGASPSAAPAFPPASDVRRMAAPIAMGAEDTVAAGRVIGDLLGPASAGALIPSCAFSATAGASTVSEGAGASTSWVGWASTGGGLFVGLKTFLGGISASRRLP